MSATAINHADRLRLQGQAVGRVMADRVQVWPPTVQVIPDPGFEAGALGTRPPTWVGGFSNRWANSSTRYSSDWVHSGDQSMRSTMELLSGAFATGNLQPYEVSDQPQGAAGVFFRPYQFAGPTSLPVVPGDRLNVRGFLYIWPTPTPVPYIELRVIFYASNGNSLDANGITVQGYRGNVIWSEGSNRGPAPGGTIDELAPDPAAPALSGELDMYGFIQVPHAGMGFGALDAAYCRVAIMPYPLTVVSSSFRADISLDDFTVDNAPIGYGR